MSGRAAFAALLATAAVVVASPVASSGDRVVVGGAPGAWSSATALPVATLDAGGAALGGRLYVVGGKTPGPGGASVHQSTLYIYTPGGGWRRIPRGLPGPAVENPAAVAYRGRLFVFGGSTDAFSGAVRNAAVFNPVTGRWRRLRPMPSARGGATARAIGRRIFVAGGMDGTGRSLASLLVYNSRTNRWRRGRPMRTRRDNPGSAVLRGRDGKLKLYVFGGRTRNADGSEVDGTLATVEMYNPGTKRWAPRTPMPTGRRTMAVGTLNGRAQLIGGERPPGGGAFAANEEYDPVGNRWRTLAPVPTPRHGMAVATIRRVVYTAGGATATATSSYERVNERFSL